MKPLRVTSRARGVRGVVAAAAAALLCTLAPAVPAAAAAGHPAPAASSAGGHAPRADYQTPGQASAQARKTGKPVPVTGATTPVSTLTANPDGTYTVTESGTPVRAKVNGTWKNLNADLTRNSNGTFSPAVSSTPLTLSGGGTGPLATMSSGPYSLALTAPMTLPAPQVTGNIATYRSVLPGVTLIVTATPSGGFDEVFEVADAKAAASPALRSLGFAVKAKGLTLHTAGDGEITATGRGGQAIFSAPPSDMWDSSIAPGLKTRVNKAGTRVNVATAQPAASTAQGPGTGARTARLGVTVSGGRLVLTPSRSLLAGSKAAWPEYIDPSWDSAGESASSWAYVSGSYPDQPYYDVNTALQVGVEPGSGTTSYAFYTMPMPSRIKGTTIHSATVYFPEIWAYSCTASPVDLYLTGGISSSTDYNNQPSWGANLGSDNVAYGWSSTGEVGGASSCPYSAKDVSYDITSTIASDAAGTLPSSLTFGLKAEDTSNSTGWKQFADPKFSAVPENATITITYAATPAKPVLSTSPPANCSSGTTVLGDGDVYLKAAVADADGGTLSVAYAAYADGKTADTFASNPSMTVSAGSGTTAQLELAAKDLESAASKYGTGGAVTITWSATVSTGLSGVPSASASCSFTFSDATPGAPAITDSGGNPGCGTLTYSVGTKASFTAAASDGTMSTTRPLSYAYQLNGGNPVTVTAGTSAPYSAPLTVTPTRITNVLDVTAIGAGGNLGQTFSCVLNAAPPGPATDQDMTDDGIPDLLTVGTGSSGGTAPGLWLATGQGDNGRFGGTVTTTPTDIAPNGPQDTGTPDSWNGLQAITGQFTGPGFNDIEAYQPGAGSIYLLNGAGDGSAATSQDQNLTGVFGDEPAISSADCADGSPSSSTYPQQLVNAYNVSGDNEPYPDQIGLFDDTASGSQYLAYFANNDSVNSFDAGNLLGLPYELTNPSPDGTMDWADWTVTTDSDTRDGTAYTDMWLRNQSTGALYLWELTGLTGETAGTSTFDFSTGTEICTNPSAALAYTQTEISSSWDKGTPLATFQATDINGGPGLATVTNTGQVQSWKWNGTALTQANAAGSTQALLFTTHEWQLDDATSGTAATAADTGTGSHLPLTGNSGVTWNTDDVLGAAADFNGTTGDMTTSSQVLNTTGNWSVSAWVKPDALGGIVLSQYGTEASCLRLSIATTTTNGVTTGNWLVGTTNADSATATSATATAGTNNYGVQIGVWTHLTVTYDASAGFLRLYVDGIPDGDVTTTSTWSGGCNTFALGQWMSDGGYLGGNFNGEIADVQTWNETVLTPAQAATLSGTPGYVLFPSNSQQFTSAPSPTDWQWTTPGAEMNFYQGVLTIQDTGGATNNASFGTSGNPDAVLTLQTDGNLVIYPNAATADAANGDDLWKSMTGGDTGDVMIFQPDGNLVIYGTYGQALWASETAN